jgi:hypothetical protein
MKNSRIKYEKTGVGEATMNGSPKWMIIVIGVLLMAVSSGYAGIPQLLSYQGRLTDSSGIPFDTTVGMTFTIYDDSTGGTSKWTETLDSVIVTDGLFSVLIGSLNPILDTVFNDSTRYLGIQLGADPEISPRTRIGSVAYAIRAIRADTAAVALSGPLGQGGWTDDGTVVRLTTFTDNVGIGTTTPSEKLEVDGSIKANNDVVAGGSIVSGNSLSIDGTNDKITASGGEIDFDDDNLLTSGGIRIGNTSQIDPNLKLGMRGPCDSTTPLMRLYHETSVPWDLLNAVFDLYNPAYDYTPLAILGAGAIIQRRTNRAGFKGEDGGLVVNRISPDTTYFNGGPVGIGTASPTGLFQVAGNAEIDDTLRVRIASGVRIGIGVDTPQSPLHVKGSGLNGEATIKIEDDYYNHAWNLVSNAHGFQITEDDVGALLTIGPTTGRIGIGTDSPTDRLDVAEDARFRNSVTVNERINILAPGDPIIEGYALQVNGKTKMQNLAFSFDFDSGWLPIMPGETILLHHNLGGDPGEYMVMIYGRNPFGVHQGNFGLTYIGPLNFAGLEWSSLTADSITLTRGNADNQGSDTDWDEVRVRILRNL